MPRPDIEQIADGVRIICNLELSFSVPKIVAVKSVEIKESLNAIIR